MIYDVVNNLRSTFEALNTHLEQCPGDDATLSDRERWFESFCECLGVHLLAIKRMQEITSRLKNTGFGYYMDELIKE